MAVWQVNLSKKVARQIRELPDKRAKESLFALLRDIELHGPVRGNWLNYGKLRKGKPIAILKKGVLRIL